MSPAPKIRSLNARAVHVPMRPHRTSSGTISILPLAVTPTCQLLEYADWADPIVQEPVVVRDGHVLLPERPGAGLEWNEAAVRRFLV